MKLSLFKNLPKDLVSFTSPPHPFPRKCSFLLSSMAISSYNWNKEKLPDHEMIKHYKDIDFCSRLKVETLSCQECGKRLKVDYILPDNEYCTCNVTKQPGYVDGWTPYVERKDIIVWRKEHELKKGLYHYKLYGVFDDITVWEFLAVQLDLSTFRLGWDTSTAQCKQVDIEQNDENKQESEEENPPSKVLSNCCIGGGNNSSEALVYYWEVNWPTFFSNRCSVKTLTVFCFFFFFSFIFI